MAALTLNQAAKAAKKSKATLLDAISSGRLSAVKNDLQQWQIDPSELFRVYPANHQENQQETATDRATDRPEPPETAVLTEKISHLEQMLQTVKAERERERELLEAQLDREREQADHWRRQATALLTHQPEPKPEPAANPASPSLVERLFGRRGT